MHGRYPLPAKRKNWGILWNKNYFEDST